MYNLHFGLEKAPFKITPDTGMFYTGGGRGEVLEALVYAIVSGEGIIKVVGEVGTGKTMLCRMLELKLPGNVDIVYLANPSLSPEDIVHAIALEMSLDVDAGANRIQVLHRLQQHLVDMHARNRHVVVLVEEAQSMPTSTLEEIRLLSNLETKQDKLLQIVLFGQPELDGKLADQGIRQLRDRITHSFYLDPLDPADVRDYVDFRLRGAGFRGRDAFSKGAYEMMARTSEGLTRRVNILADKALLAAFAEDKHDVRRKHVRMAANDSQFARTRRWGWPEATVSAGLVTISLAIGWALLGSGAVERVSAGAAPAPGGGAGFVSDVRVAAAVPSTPAPSDPLPVLAPAPAVEAVAVRVEEPVARIPPEPVAAPPPPPVPAVVEVAAVESAPAPTAARVPAALARAAPRPAAPIAAAMARPAAAPGGSGERGSAPAPVAAAPAPSSLVDARLDATRSWLEHADRSHYSIQLLVTDVARRASLEAFLRTRERADEIDGVYVYRTDINGESRFGVLYREYSTFAEARSALERLPPDLARYRPFIRNVRDIAALG